MKTFLYHGNCADGFTAAWAARAAMIAFGQESTSRFIAVFHGKPIPIADCAGSEVYLLDFCYKAPELCEIYRTATSLTILDHHKGIVPEVAKFIQLVDPDHEIITECVMAEGKEEPITVTSGNQRNFRLEYDLHRSGARIAWDYFHPKDKSIPPLVKVVEDRDLWRFQLPYTKEIMQAIFSYEYDFATWNKLDMMLRTVTGTENLILEGGALMRKHMKDIEEYLTKGQSVMNINGFLVPVANMPYFYSSEAGHKMAIGHPFSACYYWHDGAWQFSLRSASDGIDVAEIASSYGGGGHKHAAGFAVKKLTDIVPF